MGETLWLVALFAFGIWSIGFASDDGPAPVLPDTQEQFSLDLKVAGSADHGVVYAVEQRARPAYRIFSFDPRTGVDTTVFTVPEDAIIYGIALDADDQRLAVTYSPDFHLQGSGLWTLDLDSGDFEMVGNVETGVYHADPVWSADGESVLTTRINRTGDVEQLDVASIDTNDGTTTTIVANGINPVIVGGDVFYLAVDQDGARRSINLAVENTDTVGVGVTVASGSDDLDHLVGSSSGLSVAVIDDPQTDSGLTFGGITEAHGSHDVPSTWWTVSPDDPGTQPEPVALDALTVYDAASTDDAIVAATLEGLAIVRTSTSGSPERIDLIKSRAIRFVAG